MLVLGINKILNWCQITFRRQNIYLSDEAN